MTKKDKKQLNFRLEVDLVDFLQEYADNNYKTVAAVVRELVVELKKQTSIPK